MYLCLIPAPSSFHELVDHTSWQLSRQHSSTWRFHKYFGWILRPLFNIKLRLLGSVNDVIIHDVIQVARHFIWHRPLQRMKIIIEHLWLQIAQEPTTITLAALVRNPISVLLYDDYDDDDYDDDYDVDDYDDVDYDYIKQF